MNPNQKPDQTSLPMQGTEPAMSLAEMEPTVSRRRLLKALVAAGSIAATTPILPVHWIRPLTETGALSVHAQVSSSPTVYQYELTIPAIANIFGAGHATPPNNDLCAQAGVSGGTLPPYILIPSGARRVLTFDAVTGLIRYINVAPYNGPDGGTDPSYTDRTTINSHMGISGIRCIGRTMFLVGVFLSDTEPMDPAPPRLDFTGAIDFTSIAPLLNQTFFVGDGLTGTGSGNVQMFSIPEGTTRLFLGIADSGLQDDPGCYGDNSGSFTANFRITVP